MVDAHMGPSGPHTNRAVHASCSACAHPWTAHDPIAARFCHVTTTARYRRGCVCTTAYRDSLRLRGFRGTTPSTR